MGDILLEVSAVTLTAGKEGLYAQNGYGDRPFDNFSRSMMNCLGQDFDTVMNVRASVVVSASTAAVATASPTWTDRLLGFYISLTLTLPPTLWLSLCTVCTTPACVPPHVLG